MAQETKPPLFKSWTRMYLFVLGQHAVLIILMYLLFTF